MKKVIVLALVWRRLLRAPSPPSPSSRARQAVRQRRHVERAARRLGARRRRHRHRDLGLCGARGGGLLCGVRGQGFLHRDRRDRDHPEAGRRERCGRLRGPRGRADRRGCVRGGRRRVLPHAGPRCHDRDPRGFRLPVPRGVQRPRPAARGGRGDGRNRAARGQRGRRARHNRRGDGHLLRPPKLRRGPRRLRQWRPARRHLRHPGANLRRHGAPRARGLPRRGARRHAAAPAPAAGRRRHLSATEASKSTRGRISSYRSCSGHPKSGSRSCQSWVGSTPSRLLALIPFPLPRTPRRLRG